MSNVRKLFLPGAGASARFWQPVINELPPDWDCRSLSWPGLGDEPHDPEIQGLDDVASMVIERMAGPTDLVAQSMGGLIAVKVALCAPQLVRRMVLTGTSGGIPVDELGGAEWRAQYRADFPNALPWITDIREDYSAELPKIGAPTLLLWGNRDAVSPIAVGERLRSLLPSASLRIVTGGDHDFPETHAAEVAGLVREHLGIAG